MEKQKEKVNAFCAGVALFILLCTKVPSLHKFNVVYYEKKGADG